MIALTRRPQEQHTPPATAPALREATGKAGD